MNTPNFPLPVVIDDDDKVGFLFASGDSLTVHWRTDLGRPFAVIEVHSGQTCMTGGDPLVAPPNADAHTAAFIAVMLLSAAGDGSPVLDEVGIEFPPDLTAWASTHSDLLITLADHLQEVWS